jgi:hypothetical protein
LAAPRRRGPAKTMFFGATQAAGKAQADRHQG